MHELDRPCTDALVHEVGKETADGRMLVGVLIRFEIGHPRRLENGLLGTVNLLLLNRERR